MAKTKAKKSSASNRSGIPVISGVLSKVRSVIGSPTDLAALTGAERVKDQLAAIVESCQDAIISVTLDGLVVTWNLGAEQMYGFSASEMVGRSVGRIFPLERRHELARMLEAILDGQIVHRYVTQRLTKSGDLVDVAVTVSPIRDRDGEIVGSSSIARDITQEQTLIRRQREFVSITSHELRTPLTALTGYLSLAEAEHDPDRQAVFVERAFQAARRLTRLTEDLLQVARLEEERVAFQIRPIVPTRVVADVLEDVRPTVDDRGLTLIYSETISKARIKVDRVRLAQIVRNLLDNAIKYTPAPGTIEVTVKGNTHSVAICITDTGVGIDSANLDRIFDKFFREYHGQSVSTPGAGLGLYITKELVERQGGELTITGRRGRGATAIVRFPRYVPPKDGRRKRTAAAKPKPKKVTAKR